MYKKDPLLTGRAVNEAIAVFELAKRIGCRVVYASSSSLYNGLQPPHREDMAIQVTDYYTEARLAIERIAELYKRLYDIDSIGLRFFSVYGPREKSKGQYANMVSQFLWRMVKGESPIIYGDGSQTRDFIYVEDVVKALRLAMDSDFHGILNIGTGTSYSFREVVSLIEKKLGISSKPKYVENPIKNYVAHTLADTSNAEVAIGFKAQMTLDRGLDNLLKIEL